MTKISILGGGFVGQRLGQGLVALKNDVVFYDRNEDKVRQLQEGGSNATTDLEFAIQNSDLSFICVWTPTNPNGEPALDSLMSLATKLGQCLAKHQKYHVTAVKSTVLPTTTENMIIPTLEKYSGKRVGPDIGVCVNPDFMTERHRSWTSDTLYTRDFFNADRIVIGEFDSRSGRHLKSLFMPLGLPTIRTTLRTAELVKYACNCALATKISYWNELYYVCEKLGVDSNLVADLAAMDNRIGRYGTVHGMGFGGSCLPKDLKAFIKFAEELRCEPRLLKAVQEINERIRREKGVRE